MKFISLLFATAIVSLSASAQFKSPHYISNARVFKLAPNLNETDYLPKTLIFKVKPEFRNTCSVKAIQNSAFNMLLQSLGAKGLQKKFPNHKAPENPTNALGQKYADLSLIYEFTYTADLPVEAAANKLLKSGMFDYAEPHYLPHVCYQPNDPLATTGGQYHLNKIKAYTAWDITHGDTSIVIGVTDTGTEPTHPDLGSNIKHNYNDPIDGIDNDGDSLIDNFSGWDVGMNDNDPTWQGDAHGVHVCGLAAARTDNSIGVAGVGFECKFLPVKIADANGALIAAYEGIVYAADHGCSVINCSWGGYGGGAYGQSIIDYATINKNVLVVCASGNDNKTDDHYPSAYNYALSVASTNTNDLKSSFSNYGNTIDVCAPGSQIKSTFSNGTYANLSGTSMASPIAAGGAAIVKAMFPTYTALQIGEQLKATCDAISASVSGPYAGKLGKGRINLFEGTTNTNTKSVTMTSRYLTDGNDDTFVANDTLQIKNEFTNFLSPLTNLTITLSSLSAYVTVLNPSMPIGPMTTLQMINNNLNPFLVVINPGAPANSIVTFKVNFSDGSYTFNYYFNQVINVDYINVTVNDIFTSITSKGKIGFNTDGQVDGLGFKYKNGRQLLYEGGLMIGNSSSKVTDMIRGITAGVADEDFGSAQAVSRTLPSIQSDFDLSGIFTDSPAPNPIELQVNHKAFAWNSPGNTKYVIVEYTILNTALSSLTNLYAGIFADWDIDDVTYQNNRVGFDAANKMGYAFYTGNDGTYVGIKLLTATAPVLHYAIDNITGGGGGVDLNNGGFSEAEKYITLSTNRPTAGVSGTGADICDVVSTGPFSLGQGDSVVVAFALLAGDSLSDLQLSAVNAQMKYDSLYPPLSVLNQNLGNTAQFSLFPNPAKDYLSINYTCTEKQTVVIEIKNALGQKVKIVLNEQQNAGHHRIGISTSALARGVYFVQLISDMNVITEKIMIE